MKPETIVLLNKLHLALRAPINGLGAVVITYAFVAILMLASAQQRVSARLAALDPSLDYSSASELVEQVKNRNDEINKLQADFKLSSNQLSDANQKASDAHDELERSWFGISLIVNRKDVIENCGVPKFSSDQASDNEAKQAAMQEEISSTAYQCLSSGIFKLTSFSGPILPLFQDFDKKYTLYRQAYAAGGAPFTRMTEDGKTLSAFATPLPKAAAAVASFAELDAFHKSWFLAGDSFITLPPAMLQIFLALVSGLFGALLITLVLIVYPKNNMTLSSDGNYGSRILLGGLIAICVYVVLNGGTSVLGNVGFQEGQANYMTFCAVGILAGMFSDRVAAWLSDRASSFFKTGTDAVVDPKPDKKDKGHQDR